MRDSSGTGSYYGANITSGDLNTFVLEVVKGRFFSYILSKFSTEKWKFLDGSEIWRV